MHSTQLPAIPKSSTGIEGFDQILNGGLPTARTSLFIGGPGAGKSLFGLEFVYRGALAGQPGIFISFEERADALRANTATMGWDVVPLEKKGMLFLLEARIDPKAIVTGEFGFQSFLSILDHKIQAMGAKHVVIDAIDALLRLINDPRREQDELFALHQWLSDRALTAVLTVKAPRTGADPQHYEFLDYLAECVILLDNRMQGQLSTRRLRVLKYRGSGFGSNEYPFAIGPPGIKLLPISDVGLSHQALGEKFSTGLPSLDQLLGGGLRRASSILVTGGTGTGKTTLCSTIAQAAAARGEKVLYVSFEESEAALVSTMQSPGIQMTAAIGAGRLRMLTAMPEAGGAEFHLIRTLDVIAEMKPGLVLLESASACKRMGTEQAAFEYLMRLINSCKERGITILATNQSVGFHNLEEVSGIGISSLIDTVIQLALIDHAGGLRRRLVVMKSRGSAHSHRYNDFQITDTGIDIRPEAA